MSTLVAAGLFLCTFTSIGIAMPQVDPPIPWKPAAGPLMTRWAADVSPENVHAEYPRPQMARERWMSLNGLWAFGRADTAPASPKDQAPALPDRILVPFPPESALSGLMIPPGRQFLHYRREFKVPTDWAGSRVLLHFGAVDYRSEVYVNGVLVAKHTGGYDPFSADITDAIKGYAESVIDVVVADESDGTDQPRGKQVLKPEGIWYTPTSGIWQTVWLEPVPSTPISDLRITPDVKHQAVRLAVDVAGEDSDLMVTATVRDGARAVAAATFKRDSEATITIPDAKPWSPDSPFLYDLRLELLRGGAVVDTVDSYFGMRSIEVGKDAQGINRLVLNGKPIFMVGPLDQGFWPDGLYTAPTDEALRYDLEATKRLGFNMTRKHVKVEPARWYYWADKLGLLVWQDMPSGNNSTDSGRKQFEHELQAMMANLHNHPSIVMWVVFNEGWGQYDTERVCKWVGGLDPSRLVDNASGWTDKGVGNVIDMHNYPDASAPARQADRAAVLGEFGGLGLPIEGHRWKNDAWGYQDMRDADHLTRRYGEVLRNAYRLRDSAGLCAVVYTQITDVEIECNGLLTYDRDSIKGDESLIARANRGDFSWLPQQRTIVAAADGGHGAMWRFTTERPADGWLQPEFNDGSWRQGEAGFGTRGTPGARIGTEWNTPEIWLRREVLLDEGLNPSRIWLWVHHDEDAEVYLNGIKAGTLTGFTTGYGESQISPEATRSIHPGRNVIAIHCRQTSGGQYIDAGLIEIMPPKP